jgi:hypothetical protein
MLPICRVRYSGFSNEPRWPSGLTASAGVLPHAPYANPSTAVVHAWRDGHWFTRQHQVQSYDAASRTFTFGLGGFQVRV